MIARDGAKVVVQSDRGVQYSRNAQDVKKIPMCLEAESEQANKHADKDANHVLSQAQDTTDEDNKQTSVIIRPQRTLKKPNRFKDMILFSIFE